ncbi:Uncharacterised protein [Mycobacterium tuberculosis]|nr:Uncharacterised protein [Mycobacterium tuberculosis]
MPGRFRNNAEESLDEKNDNKYSSVADGARKSGPSPKSATAK